MPVKRYAITIKYVFPDTCNKIQHYQCPSNKEKTTCMNNYNFCIVIIDLLATPMLQNNLYSHGRSGSCSFYSPQLHYIHSKSGVLGEGTNILYTIQLVSTGSFTHAPILTSCHCNCRTHDECLPTVVPHVHKCTLFKVAGCYLNVQGTKRAQYHCLHIKIFPIYYGLAL